jgi:hypothetical protein
MPACAGRVGIVIKVHNRASQSTGLAPSEPLLQAPHTQSSQSEITESSSSDYAAGNPARRSKNRRSDDGKLPALRSLRVSAAPQCSNSLRIPRLQRPARCASTLAWMLHRNCSP